MLLNSTFPGDVNLISVGIQIAKAIQKHSADSHTLGPFTLQSVFINKNGTVFLRIQEKTKDEDDEERKKKREEGDDNDDEDDDSELVKAMKGEDVDNINIDGMHYDDDRWTAPELHFGNEEPTSKSDIFSLGLFLWSLFTKEVPFQEVDKASASLQIYGSHRPDLITLNNHFLSMLVQKCWNQDPAERPDAEDVISSLKEVAEDTKVSINTNTNDYRIVSDDNKKTQENKNTSGSSFVDDEQKSINHREGQNPDNDSVSNHVADGEEEKESDNVSEW